MIPVASRFPSFRRFEGNFQDEGTARNFEGGTWESKWMLQSPGILFLKPPGTFQGLGGELLLGLGRTVDGQNLFRTSCNGWNPKEAGW